MKRLMEKDWDWSLEDLKQSIVGLKNDIEREREEKSFVRGILFIGILAAVAVGAVLLWKWFQEEDDEEEDWDWEDFDDDDEDEEVDGCGCGCECNCDQENPSEDAD